MSRHEGNAVFDHITEKNRVPPQKIAHLEAEHVVDFEQVERYKQKFDETGKGGDSSGTDDFQPGRPEQTVDENRIQNEIDRKGQHGILHANGDDLHATKRGQHGL